MFNGSELGHLSVAKKLSFMLKIMLEFVGEPLRVLEEEYEACFDPSEGDTTVLEEQK